MTDDLQKKAHAEIQSANLSCVIPLKTSDDFSFSFAVVANGSDHDASRQALISNLQKILPEMKPVKLWGDDTSVNHFSISEKDKPGICKHLVRMFQEAGVNVGANGSSRYTEPPYLASSHDIKDLPEELSSYERFQSAVLGLEMGR